jgi:ABC-type uncharacterized transport system permease subunit
MKDPIVLAALIAAVPATLTAIFAIIRYIVSTILDAYKSQAIATIAAKDAEIRILERLHQDDQTRHQEDMAEIQRLRESEKIHLSTLKALGG